LPGELLRLVYAPLKNGEPRRVGIVEVPLAVRGTPSDNAAADFVQSFNGG